MKVRFIRCGAQEETEGYRQLNLLGHAQLLEWPLGSRCGGHAICGTCRVIVLSGTVSPLKEEERHLLGHELHDEKGREWRLACQTFPEGDPEETIEVWVPAVTNQTSSPEEPGL